jgi:hypothetical protein
MVNWRRLAGGALPCIAALACAPQLEDDLSLVSRRRLLAVMSSPAEVGPGDGVELRALVVDEAGSATSPEPSWAFCTERKPLQELGPVAQSCLEPSGKQFVEAGLGLEINASLPKGTRSWSDGTTSNVDACQLFGPQLPTGATGGRPVDPDPTGGYYQPVRLLLEPQLQRPTPALAQVRIVCPAAGLNQEQNTVFSHAYRRNTAPAVIGISAFVNGAEAAATDTTLSVAVGDRLELTLTFPSCARSSACDLTACDDRDVGAECPSVCFDGNICAGAERYAWIDPLSKRTQILRESLDLAWYRTGGSWDDAHAGVQPSESDGLVIARNVWQASTRGNYTLWVVIRDDRGAASWLERRVEVR